MEQSASRNRLLVLTLSALTVALFSLCAGVNPCNSSRSPVVSSPRALFDSTRKLGTLSRSAAILSFKFVLYRFSIMLWAVFLTG